MTEYSMPGIRELKMALARLDSLFEYAEANQAVVLTPFILMGAMSPVTIPARE